MAHREVLRRSLSTCSTCGISRAIGAYVVQTDDGLALFDCGPATCLQHLRDGLASRALSLDDIRHILLSHIHLDHAGAAGAIVRDHPHIQVHVSGSAPRT